MIFKNGERIVFAGDSVTDHERIRPIGEGLDDSLGRGYVHFIDNFINIWYPDLCVRITNAGIGGNTSRDLLGRFKTDVLDLKPDWVSICIGINDVWRQFDSPAIVDSHVYPDEYEANVEKMLELLSGKVKGVFLMTPYYMEPNKNDLMRSRMDEYGQICKKLSEKHGCIFVDLQAVFNQYLTYRHSTFLSWDRVHPNQAGATIIAREFLKHCDFDYDK